VGGGGGGGEGRRGRIYKRLRKGRVLLERSLREKKYQEYRFRRGVREGLEEDGVWRLELSLGRGGVGGNEGGEKG
jgi:hypothetical protein